MTLNSLAIMLFYASVTATIVDVVWNDFWLQECNGSAFPLRTAFGISANPDNTQNGAVVTILGEGSLQGQIGKGPFLDWPRIDPNGTLIHGGVPQRANLSIAMLKITEAIELLPLEFSGYLYFDMEEWDPLWDITGSLYRNASITWVLQREPHLPLSAATVQAQHEYETAAREWFLTPLETARRLRPHAIVGYYNFPKCANDMGCSQFPPGSNATSQNDKLSWLWKASSGLFPTIYWDFIWHTGPGPIIREARRLAGHDKFVMPLWWYYGCSSELHTFCSKANQIQQWQQAVAAGVNGFVVWGGGKASALGCAAFESYVNDTLGPVARHFTRADTPSVDII